MKIRKLICLVLSVALCICLCGCDLLVFETDDLITPPQLTGDMYPIGKVIESSTGGNYTLKYPSAGDRRSAVILEDIEGDGTFEAFAFYSTSDDELTNMHINVICQRNGKWVSIADQSLVAGGVDRVDFCDLDGDGTLEILVGWEIYGNSEKQLAVYSLSGNTLSQRLLQQYTGFLCCDLDGNGDNEIFLQLLNTTQGTNSATVYNLEEDGIRKLASCAMDGSVKTADAPKLSKLTNGKPAIYIDEVKGIGAITEVLFLSAGALKNPLLEGENALENIKTLRAASLSSADINGDGIVDIPIAAELPSADSSTEKLYYTNWYSFSGTALALKLVTVVNTIDGYYLRIPQKFIGTIAITKDIENHRRIIHAYDSENSVVGEKLAEIEAVDIEDWNDEDFDRGALSEIGRNGSVVFAAEINDAAKTITFEELKEMFSLVQ